MTFRAPRERLLVTKRVGAVSVITRVTTDQAITTAFIKPDSRLIVFAHFEPQGPLPAVDGDALGVGKQPAAKAGAAVLAANGDGVKTGNR